MFLSDLGNLVNVPCTQANCLLYTPQLLSRHHRGCFRRCEKLRWGTPVHAEFLRGPLQDALYTLYLQRKSFASNLNIVFSLQLIFNLSTNGII